MKPEPLKNKEISMWVEDFGEKKPIGTSKMFHERGFLKENIKSAIEWLMEEDMSDIAEFLQGDIKSKELFKRMFENRNKAFEDVTNGTAKKEI
jgi:hypothetical protein